MSSFLIIGCGYLGQQLCHLLTQKKHQVYYLKRSAQTNQNIGHHIQKDWFHCQREDLPKVDFIVYTMSPDNTDLVSYQQAYPLGIQHLLNLLTPKSAPAKIIMASSTSTYDVQDGSRVTEDFPCHPTQPTVQAIVEAETMLIDSDYDFCIARFGGIYGTGRHHLLDLIRQGKIEYPNKRVFSNRIHVVDAAQIILHLATLTYNEGIYNCVDPDPNTLTTIVSWLSCKLGTPIDHQPLNQQEVQQARLTNKQVSCERLLHTGYQFTYPSFREGLTAIMKDESINH